MLKAWPMICSSLVLVPRASRFAGMEREGGQSKLPQAQTVLRRCRSAFTRRSTHDAQMLAVARPKWTTCAALQIDCVPCTMVRASASKPDWRHTSPSLSGFDAPSKRARERSCGSCGQGPVCWTPALLQTPVRQCHSLPKILRNPARSCGQLTLGSAPCPAFVLSCGSCTTWPIAC